MRHRQPPLPFDLEDGERAWTPPGIGHPSASAYNHYGCRCAPCKEWRRSYDREYWELKRSQRERGRKR